MASSEKLSDIHFMEWDKNPWVLRRQIKVYIHTAWVWDVRGILLTKGIMQEANESSAVIDESRIFSTAGRDIRDE